ncbi:MAG TPA: methyltransferase domain-containing protein [Gemmatimonadales bacterium]|jgi:hypothetical protein
MTSGAFDGYWRRKQLLEAPPRFPVRRWWDGEALCDIERVYLAAIGAARTLLDVGAGDLRIRRRFQAAGFRGVYHTQDIGGEFNYDYASLEEVKQSYDAILCLDVVEHIGLAGGLALLGRLIDLLTPGGVLIVQTPNARCIRHPSGWDMTHVHAYNAPDLWAWLTAQGLACDGFRVRFGRPARAPHTVLLESLSAFVVTRLLGADYADNIALIARKAR